MNSAKATQLERPNVRRHSRGEVYQKRQRQRSNQQFQHFSNRAERQKQWPIEGRRLAWATSNGETATNLLYEVSSKAMANKNQRQLIVRFFLAFVCQTVQQPVGDVR